MTFNYSSATGISASSGFVIVLNRSNVTELLHSEPDDVVSINYEPSTMIVLATVLSVLIIFTALGNLLVGMALFRFRALRTISNCLIGNLAASDFLLAVTVLPLSAATECLGYWAFGRIACSVWLVVDVLCCTASIWNLCVIAADRYTATVHPVWYRDRSSARLRALAYIGVVWAMSITVCLPPLFGWNNEENFRTMVDKSTGLKYSECAPFRTPGYVLYSALGSFFVPFFLTVALYVRIAVAMHQRHESRRERRRMTLAGNRRSGGTATEIGRNCHRCDDVPCRQ